MILVLYLWPRYSSIIASNLFKRSLLKSNTWAILVWRGFVWLASNFFFFFYIEKERQSEWVSHTRIIEGVHQIEEEVFFFYFDFNWQLWTMKNSTPKPGIHLIFFPFLFFFMYVCMSALAIRMNLRDSVFLFSFGYVEIILLPCLS